MSLHRIFRTGFAALILAILVTMGLFLATAFLSSNSGVYTLGPSSFYFWETTRTVGTNGASEVSARPGLALTLVWIGFAGLAALSLWRRSQRVAHDG
ncbi:MAG: hypothetical protein GY926_19760 [bacterium]|nr:hypothetical protein [bacterium]